MALTIVFDFDGTLHDSLYIYRTAFPQGYQWLVDNGYAGPREFADDYIAGNIGLNCEDAWARVCPDIPWSITENAAARVGEVMDEFIENGTARLFPGVPEMLQQLKDAGHTLVFLSNCRNAYRDAVRQTFGFDAWFDHYYTAEQFDGIPKEEIFKVIREEIPGPYIVIGDRDKDRSLAETYGLPFIGCLYGYAAAGELDNVEYLAETPVDIVELVARLDADEQDESGNSDSSAAVK